MKKLDFLAIGETTIDAFIRLEGNGIHTQGSGSDSTLCIPFATKIPYESAEEIPAVGNAANAAVSAARLGVTSALVANIGDDDNGKKCLDALKKENVDTAYIGTHPGMPTNYHYVLWFDQDRTILQKHSNFPYSLSLGADTEPQWIYLTSLGENSLEFHNTIGDFLTTHPNTKLAFQPGIFQIKFGVEKLKKVYAETDVFCCNVEEAQVILNETSHDLKTLLKAMAALGPKIVLITDGIDGAYAYDTTEGDGGFYFMPVYPHTPFERTGAGDAFFSTVISALAMGKTLAEALTWGPVNSMSVVQQVGAQKGLLSAEKLQEYLKTAPENYKLKKI